MKQLLVSFHKRNVYLRSSRFAFTRSHNLRFEWIALLAFKRAHRIDDGWTTIDEICRLPHWHGENRNRHNAAINVGRYLQELTRNEIFIVTAERPWSGPYRLSIPSRQIEFDLQNSAIRKQLGMRERSVTRDLDALYIFTRDFVRATSLLFQEELDIADKQSRHDDARRTFMALAKKQGMPTSLRVLAYLAAVRILHRFGELEAAAESLDDCGKYLKKISDAVLKAEFHIANAWHSTRTGDYNKGQRELDLAEVLIGSSEDKRALAALENEQGLLLAVTKKYEEALPCYLTSLQASLMAGNYYRLKQACFFIGSLLRSLGKRYQSRSTQWVHLSIDVVGWMRLHKAEAQAEILLAEMYLESKEYQRFEHWVAKADSFASTSGRWFTVVECHILRARYFRKIHKNEAAVDALASARNIYLQFEGSDVQDHALAHEFPEEWKSVMTKSYGFG